MIIKDIKFNPFNKKIDINELGEKIKGNILENEDLNLNNKIKK